MNKPLTKTLLLIGLVMASGSCSLNNSNLMYPHYEGVGFTARKPTEKEQLIMKSDFSMEVVRVADQRRVRSTAMDAPDAIIYEYEPNDLLQGLTFRAPVLFNKYFAIKPRDPMKHYKVEVVIREMKTQIVAGDLVSGRMGRYRVYLDTDVLVRRPDSLVVVNRPYSVEADQVRKSYNGRHPSMEMDRARTYDLLEDSIRNLAQNVAWDVRMTDARRWDPYKDARKEDRAAANKALIEHRKATKALRNDVTPKGVDFGEDGKPMMGPRNELVEPTQPETPALPEETVPTEPIMEENLGWGVGS